MELFSLPLITVILVVAVFDFTNGFHDAADMVATAIASRAMRPATAITIVSGFTFIAPFTVGLAVADTVGTFIDISSSSPLTGESVVIGALLAAISYNLATWRLGYPSSSSNSLAGGLEEDDIKRIMMHSELLGQLKEVAKRIRITANSLEDMAIKII